ncbi:Aspartyl protease family protein [Thalictrum thalictroides]|uniref:Aspartyl protease family protein n=1 Tax=Thalictrum thalictroides TaxID=46969 RepID=A0A7J6VYJ3_THATH|nr:Aspartyl protease family protein [Thalictrum thalictroides]
MAITLLLPFLLLFPFLDLAQKGYAHGAAGQVNHLIETSSFLPATTCSSSISTIKDLENKQSSLNIVHRHGACSSLFLDEGQEKTKTSTEFDPEEFLKHDQMRVEALHFKLTKRSANTQEQSAKATVLPVQIGASLGTANYIVRVGFGTPAKYMSLIFDTGSDLTWIQCKPCSKFCYDQQDAIFNPSESTSYSTINCTTRICFESQYATGISPSCGDSASCVYGIQYGDQSFSLGYLVNETLSITSTDVVNKFTFGCGQNNQGLFGKAAGLLGLGRHRLSIVSQTLKKYGGRFSYCLPSTSSSNGRLTFGAQKRLPSSVKFTPMVKDSRGPSYYFLNLVGISVGGKKLAISASVFASSGTIIDSGTVISRLPRTAYTSLQSAFKQFMSSYRSAKPLSILDTCFNLTGYKEVRIPKIALLFKGGVTLDVDPSGLLFIRSIEQVCLAFAANQDDKDVGIIGNTQQQRMEVIYDVAKSKLGFVPGSCA